MRSRRRPHQDRGVPMDNPWSGGSLKPVSPTRTGAGRSVPWPRECGTVPSPAPRQGPSRRTRREASTAGTGAQDDTGGPAETGLLSFISNSDQGARSADLLDCGHVGQFAGVCQFEQCGKKLCQQCCQSCTTCGKLLCPSHQVAVDTQMICCPADAKTYVAKRVALRLLGRD